MHKQAKILRQNESVICEEFWELLLPKTESKPNNNNKMSISLQVGTAYKNASL